MPASSIRIAVFLLLSTGYGAHAVQAASIADLARRQQWSELKRELQSGAEVNAAHPDGTCALHWAVWHESEQTVAELINAEATVDPMNRYGVTPLWLACQNGNAAIAEMLLESGADANIALDGGETALMTAARTGDATVVDLLIAAGADVHSRERNDQTAIMWAAAQGNAEVVRRLLRAGAETGPQLRSGFDPLFFAVREGRRRVVDILLESGMDVNSVMKPRSGGGRTPRSGTSPLMLAVENGHFELAIGLLRAGADASDMRSGFTVLHAITWVRKPNRGDGIDGDPPPTGSGGISSLDFVRAVVRDFGADVNTRLERGRSGQGVLGQKGATPFLMAADTADVPLMRLLLQLGADPTIPNADDCSPLLAAAGIGTKAPTEEAGTEDEALAAVKMLLDLGANINAIDKNGETAMHGAAYASWPRMARLLTDRGADINTWNQKNKYGWSPLLIAQGFRPGNFKPSHPTINAIEEIMLAAGVTPPPAPKRKTGNLEYRDDNN